MAKYGKKAQAKVRKVMEEFKEGTLKSGRSGRKVTTRSQAVAIGLSEARAEGDKVPPRKKAAKKAVAGKAKSAGTKRTTKKRAAKKRRAKTAQKSSSKKTKGKTGKKG